jgi:hypothetical protein
MSDVNKTFSNAPTKAIFLGVVASDRNKCPVISGMDNQSVTTDPFY